jgi:type VI protein secretion system component Hcp
MKRPFLSFHLEDVLVSSYGTTGAGQADVSSKVAHQDFHFTQAISTASPATDVVIGGACDDLLINAEIAVQGVADPASFLI